MFQAYTKAFYTFQNYIVVGAKRFPMQIYCPFTYSSIETLFFQEQKIFYWTVAVS